MVAGESHVGCQREVLLELFVLLAIDLQALLTFHGRLPRALDGVLELLVTDFVSAAPLFRALEFLFCLSLIQVGRFIGTNIRL